MHISDPKLVMKDPKMHKNAAEVRKSLNSALTIANSDLNQAKL